MVRIQNVADTRWNFYEKLEEGDCENMADEFETLYYHYQQRGKRIKELLSLVRIACDIKNGGGHGEE